MEGYGADQVISKGEIVKNILLLSHLICRRTLLASGFRCIVIQLK
jgi:hypothetical protein